MPYLTGDSGTFTFTGAESITATDFGRWSADIQRSVFSTTPFGYAMERNTLGRFQARGSFTQFLDSTKPPIPANGATSGTLTLRCNGPSGGINYVFKARVYSLAIGANSITGEPETATYQFIASADSSTDTIT